MDIQMARRVVVAVLEQAVDDLRAEEPPLRKGSARSKFHRQYRYQGLRDWRRRRASAACWLASRAATRFFDWSDVDQEVSLRHIDWPRYARIVLEEHRRGLFELDPAERRLLREGIEVLGGRQMATA
jgi:hypothetical protein